LVSRKNRQSRRPSGALDYVECKKGKKARDRLLQETDLAWELDVP